MVGLPEGCEEGLEGSEVGCVDGEMDGLPLGIMNG